MKWDHSQSGGPQLWQKHRSLQNAQTDGAFCLWSSYSWDSHSGNLTFTSGPDRVFWDREEVVPCAGSCDSIGNGIDYCSLTPWFVTVDVLARVWLCVSVAIRWKGLMALNYEDKMDVAWLCWVFWMIHGDDKPLLPLGKKYENIQSLWSLYHLSSISHPSLVEDKGAFRALMRMQSESRGEEFSLYHLNYCCHYGREDFEEEVAQSDTYSTLNLWEWRCLSSEWNI